MGAKTGLSECCFFGRDYVLTQPGLVGVTSPRMASRRLTAPRYVFASFIVNPPLVLLVPLLRMPLLLLLLLLLPLVVVLVVVLLVLLLRLLLLLLLQLT